MGSAALEDVRLQQYTLDTLPRLKRLREEHFRLKSRAEVCVERAKYITEYLRDLASPDNPAIVRNAKAVRHFLSHKAPLLFDDNLLGGSTTSKPFGAPVFPEFTGLTIWPELETISTRPNNPQILSKADAELLNFDVFPFWLDRNMLEYTRAKYGDPDNMRMFQQLSYFIAAKAGCISHTVPNYRLVLERGVNSIMEEAARKMSELDGIDTPAARHKRDFYESVQIVLDGLITYARNLSQEAEQLAATETDSPRKSNLLKMAEVCRTVPAEPPRTFREAVNALWLAQIGVHAENINMAISPGRLDQLLYPFYVRDIRDGTLDMGEAVELVGCLWLKLADNTNLVPEISEELFGGAGTSPAVTVGGVDEDGEDAVNELTYVMLRATELLRTRDPNLNARYHYEKNSRVYRDRVCEVVKNTRAVPAFHNDVADIPALMRQGVSLQHARDFAIIGCVELASAGRTYCASGALLMNLAAMLELALHNGRRPAIDKRQVGPVTGDPATFDGFDQFWQAFETQARWLIGEAVALNNMFGRAYQEILPSPMLSAFFEGPMADGEDLIFGGALYNGSGATNVGFADTVDSLSAIEAAVFRDKQCTFDELLRALRQNFEGQAVLHQYLVNRTPKYGTDHPISVRNADRLQRFLFDCYQGHENYRGGRYWPAYWTMTAHAGFGKLSGALPNGRKAHQSLASGITPVSQAAKELTTCLRTVAALDCRCIPGSYALNLKYPRIDGTAEFAALADAVESFFRTGGMHIQCNVMSYEDLIAARDNPEAYQELLVRVSGYSAYFNDLNPAMKDEIIARTQYDLDTGRAVPMPDGQQAAMPSPAD